jgi:enoyl-CoA hydratase/carnithine racemase
MSRVTVTHTGHIAHVQLTRADKMNAVDQKMIDALLVAAEEVSRSGARVVVLSGAGKGFCAGTDITALGTLVGRDMNEVIMPRTHGAGTTNQWQEIALQWHRLAIPVIAALHGVAYGAGLQLALGADIRIAAPDTKLAVMEMKWGIVPDMGGFVLLPQLVRSDVLRRLVYTAEPVDAGQAERWGLVTEIADDPLAAAMALATQISKKSPSAIRAAKRLAALSQTAASDEVLMAESHEQAALIGKPEQMEVIAAQFSKRDPDFK